MLISVIVRKMPCVIRTLIFILLTGFSFESNFNIGIDSKRFCLAVLRLVVQHSHGLYQYYRPNTNLRNHRVIYYIPVAD